MLPDQVPDCSFGGAWVATTGTFYSLNDKTVRSTAGCAIKGAPGQDAEVYSEPG